jgi:ABC-2 type transport system permease protein
MVHRRLSLWWSIAGIGEIALMHALVPRLPKQAITFLQQGFHLNHIAAVLFCNDIVAVYFAAFFAGLAALSRVIIALREEPQLEPLLARPVTRAEFLAARSYFVLGSAFLAGMIVSIGCVIATKPVDGNPTSTGALGAAAAITAMVLIQLSILNILFVRIRNTLYALLIACFVWLVPMMPSAAFLYRPDLFEGHDRLMASFVMVTFISNDKDWVWLGPTLLVVAVLFSILCIRLGGFLLDRIALFR